MTLPENLQIWDESDRYGKNLVDMLRIRKIWDQSDRYGINPTDMASLLTGSLELDNESNIPVADWQIPYESTISPLNPEHFSWIQNVPRIQHVCNEFISPVNPSFCDSNTRKFKESNIYPVNPNGFATNPADRNTMNLAYPLRIHLQWIQHTCTVKP